MLLKFNVYRDGRMWGARAMGHAIFTQAKTLDRLYANIKEAAHLHFADEVDRGESLQIVIVADAEVPGARTAAAG